MKIFILDDDPKRHKIFNERLNKEGVELFAFTNAMSFIEELNKHSDPNFIFLDHDLADFGENETFDGYGGSKSEINGQHVASQIVKMTFDTEPEIVIHSVNPPGADDMKNILSPFFPVQVVPFPVLMITLKVS